MKTAILILSDPNATTDEALGRCFNGLAAAYEFQQSGDDVAIYFQGAGTRWPKALSAEDHPAHALFELVRDRVAGVCSACAAVFGASEDEALQNLPLSSGNAVPGTAGLTSLRKLLAEGRTILTF